MGVENMNNDKPLSQLSSGNSERNPSLPETYGVTLQNNLTRKISRLNSNRNKTKMPMYDETKIAYQDLVATIKGANFGPAESQNFQAIMYMIANTSNYENKRVFHFPLKEFMKIRGLKSRPSATRSINKTIDKMAELKIEYNSPSDKRLQIHGVMNVFSLLIYGDKDDPTGSARKGNINVYFTPESQPLFIKKAISSQLPLKLLQVDIRRNPTAYNLGLALNDNTRINISKHPDRAFKMKIKTLLSQCTNLPSIDEVKNRSYKSRIMEPFFNGMEYLKEQHILTYEYYTKDNISFSEISNPDIDFDTFINGNVVIDWIDAPQKYFESIQLGYKKHKRKEVNPSNK